MYAAIRRFRAGDMDEALHRADVGYARAVEKQLGFVDYHVIRVSPSEAFSVLLFQTKAALDRNRFFTDEFIDIGFAGLDVELLDEWRGEVQLSCASDLVLERLGTESRGGLFV
jgi:hypothetical protein